MSEHLFTLPSDAIAVTSDDCYTPRWVFDAMGLEFDLDVAAPPGGPWHVPARRYYTAEDDGLTQPWDGLVWCNPPFSNFKPWGFRFAGCERGALIGTYAPETYATPAVFASAEAVAFIGVKFALPGWRMDQAATRLLRRLPRRRHRARRTARRRGPLRRRALREGRMSNSGWCSAPDGARPACDRCGWAECTHTCHVPDEKEEGR